MSNPESLDSDACGDEPGTTRTRWHPLLARLLDHTLSRGYQVTEEVHVGKLPLRLDLLVCSAIAARPARGS